LGFLFLGEPPFSLTNIFYQNYSINKTTIFNETSFDIAICYRKGLGKLGIMYKNAEAEYFDLQQILNKINLLN